jgi:aminobenzoyl-glutamate transport protein
VVEPRLGKWSPDQGEGLEATDEMKGLEPDERHGLKMAMLSLTLMTLVLVWSALPGLPGGGFLLNPEAPAGQPALDYMQRLVGSPLLKGVVALIFVIGAISGIVYGVVVGTFRSDAHVMKGMAKSMSTLGEYMVLVFFAAQFVAFFNWTNIGLIFAVKGAESLESAGFTGIPLVLAFVALSAVINLFMGSASAKWAIMAPVFVPMMMQLGYEPEVTQAAYRVGDSTTNIISPMMSYFALIIAFFQRYDRKAGIGTLVATMLPYSIAFFVCWCIMLSIWLTLGLPLGF